MDENINDVLLVLLGAVASLLGTSLTLFFELRRDRQIAKRERQIKEYERLIGYLFSISRLYSGVIDYFVSTNSGLSTSLEMFQSNINPILEQISQSPLNGLPPILMSRDRTIVDQISKVNDYLSEVKIIINQIGSRKYVSADSELTKKQIKKLAEMNELINAIIQELERKLS